MKVEVTEKDIRTGIQADCMECPIALAINRSLGSGHARVRRHRIDMYNPTLKCIPLPSEARAFVLDFDRGKEVLPFSFEIAV
jgi:hypothetical protein